MAGALSTNKLGLFGHIPLVPMMPTDGQLAIQTMGLFMQMYLHLRLGESGAYISGKAPAITPDQFEGFKNAYLAAPDEPSYSGSGSTYKKLTVTPAEDGKTATLTFGDYKIGLICVHPDAPLVSGDGDGHEEVH